MRVTPSTPWLPPLALAAAMIAASVLLLAEGRDTTFLLDEWQFVLDRYEGGLDTWLEPHNGHLELFSVAVYKVLFAIAGFDDHAPWRVVMVLLHLLVVALLFVYARRRVGPWAALGAALLLLFYGTAFENLVLPFNMHFLITFAAGLGALLALDRGDRAGDVLAGVLVGCALAASSYGIAVALAVAVEIALSPRARERVAIVAAPAALYIVWRLAYPSPDQFVWGNVIRAPRFAADQFAAAVGGLLGLGLEWGRTLAVVALAAGGWALTRRTAIPARTAALLVLAAAAIVLVALTRARFGTPEGSRFLYPAGLGILLVAVELARGTAIRPRAWVVLATVVLAAVLANVFVLREGAKEVRRRAAEVQALLGAAEIARDRIPPDFDFRLLDLGAVRPGRYFAASEELGSAADTPQEIARRSEPTRRLADAVLLRALDVRLTPARVDDRPSGSAPRIAGPEGVVTSGSCHRGAATPIGAAVTVEVPPRGLVIEAGPGSSADVRLRRFAAEFADSQLGAVPAGTRMVLSIPPDRASQPWFVNVFSGEPPRVCAR